MAKLDEIVAYLDAELRTSEVKDYPGAMNGLQLENNGSVTRIFSAVDASLAVIEEAAKQENALLLVHHGMFWQGAQTISGPFYRKIKTAIDANLAIYSSHLPLDMHPEIGNNVLLAKAIGLQDVRPILIKDGWPTGVQGIWSGSRTELSSAVTKAVSREATLCAAGTDQPMTVAVISGGAGSEVARIAELGIDAFVTGEGPHWSFIEAEERQINVLYAGHYATETFGVMRLGEILAKREHLDFCFIHRPGGL